jgi:VanZ family protein
MNTGKFVVGGLIGGVLFFLLGWLIYGMLLMDFMNQHMSAAAAGVMRPEAEWPWWAMIAGNFGLGFLLSFVINKSNVASVSNGAVTGAVVMFLMSFSVNLMMYAQMNLSDLTSIAVDMIVSAVIGAVVGSVLGWWNGRK